MIHEEVHRSVNEFLETCNAEGINPDMYFQITGTTQRRPSQTIRSRSWVTYERLTLLSKQLPKLKGFDASEEEIQKEIEQLAADLQYGSCTNTKLAFSRHVETRYHYQKTVELITNTATVK